MRENYQGKIPIKTSFFTAENAEDAEIFSQQAFSRWQCHLVQNSREFFMPSMPYGRQDNRMYHHEEHEDIKDGRAQRVLASRASSSKSFLEASFYESFFLSRLAIRRWLLKIKQAGSKLVFIEGGLARIDTDKNHSNSVFLSKNGKKGICEFRFAILSWRIR